MKLLKSLVFFAFILSASTATAQAKGFSGSAGKIKMSSLKPLMSTEEAYSEQYSFSVDLDGGGHIGMDLTVSNLGWGDGHGAAEVRVNLPGHKKYKFSKKVDQEKWTSSDKGFNLEIAGTRALGRKGNFELKHNGRVKFELKFENKMPMYRPGRGKITTGDDGYLKFDLIAPRADVTGRVKIGDEWIEVTGKRKGYAQHLATNVAPFDLAQRFSRFRTYNGDVFIIWREVKMHKDLGGKSFTWMMVGYKDKIVFSDANAKLKFGAIKSDAKTGYGVPYAAQVNGKSGGDSVKLVMRGKKLKKKDLLASYGKAAKVVASAVSEPYQFDLTGDYTLQMSIGGVNATINGKGHYVIDYINK